MVLKSISKYETNSKIGCLSFLRGESLNHPINNAFPLTPLISNHIDFRVNNLKSKGDCCEIVKTELLKKFIFPEFQHEKFMGEGFLWNNIGFSYQTVYINQIIYIRIPMYIIIYQIVAILQVLTF